MVTNQEIVECIETNPIYCAGYIDGLWQSYKGEPLIRGEVQTVTQEEQCKAVMFLLGSSGGNLASSWLQGINVLKKRPQLAGYYYVGQTAALFDTMEKQYEK